MPRFGQVHHHEAPPARGVESPHLLGQRRHRLVHDAPVAGLALGRVEQRADVAGERLLRDVVVGAAPDHVHDLARLLHGAAHEVALEVVLDLTVEAAGEEELRALLDRRDDVLARHVVVLHRRGAAVRLVLDREARAVGEVVRPVRPVRETPEPVGLVREDQQPALQVAGVRQAVAEHDHARDGARQRRVAREDHGHVHAFAVARGHHRVEPRLLALHRAVERDGAGVLHFARGRGNRQDVAVVLVGSRAHALDEKEAVLDAAGHDEPTQRAVAGPGPAVRARVRRRARLRGRRQHPATAHAPRALFHGQLEVRARLVEERSTAGDEREEQGEVRCTFHGGGHLLATAKLAERRALHRATSPACRC